MNSPLGEASMVLETPGQLLDCLEREVMARASFNTVAIAIGFGLANTKVASGIYPKDCCLILALFPGSLHLKEHF